MPYDPMEAEKVFPNRRKSLKKSGLTEEAAKMFDNRLKMRELEYIPNDRAKYTDVNEDQQERIDMAREMFSRVYNFVDKYCKPGRETSLAITKLEEAQFWAIKGITREENKENGQ